MDAGYHLRTLFFIIIIINFRTETTPPPPAKFRNAYYLSQPRPSETTQGPFTKVLTINLLLNVIQAAVCAAYRPHQLLAPILFLFSTAWCSTLTLGISSHHRTSLEYKRCGRLFDRTQNI